jgi:asparagine synthase (glutamine-hydrolysing)
VHRYWTPFGHEREDTADFGAVYEEFDALLREAVARCLELGPAGISLSGGIDSTTIAVVAAEVSRQQGRPDPWAMSLRFPDPESDESTVQRAVAQAIGLPQGFASFSDACGDEGPLIETLSLAADLPMPPVVPWDLAFDALAFQAADRGCRVLLGGDGSGWLRADWALVGDLLRSLDFKSVKDMYEAERRYYRFSRWSAMKTFLWRSGVRQLVRQTAGAALVRLGADPVLGRLRRDRLLRSIPAWIAPDPDLRRELVDGWSAMLPQPRTKDFHRRSRAESLDAPYMTIPMDWYRDRSRQLGVELLDPFQDPDLVEFLCAIPPKHLFAGGRVKALARETVRRRIPEFDAKILRGVYVEELFESMLVEDGARAFELIDGMRTLSDLGIIDRDPLEKALQRGIFTAEVRYSEAWQALAVEAWLGGRMRGQSLTLRSPLG